MRSSARRGWALGAVLGLGVLGGCQTWVPEAGLTLPTSEYLRHFPTYIPQSPQYPLSRELNSLEEAAAQQAVNPPRPVLVPGGAP